MNTDKGAIGPARLDQTVERRLDGLRAIVGNSPLLAVECLWRGKRRTAAGITANGPT